MTLTHLCSVAAVYSQWAFLKSVAYMTTLQYLKLVSGSILWLLMCHKQSFSLLAKAKSWFSGLFILIYLQVIVVTVLDQYIHSWFVAGGQIFKKWKENEMQRDVLRNQFRLYHWHWGSISCFFEHFIRLYLEIQKLSIGGGVECFILG